MAKRRFNFVVDKGLGALGTLGGLLAGYGVFKGINKGVGRLRFTDDGLEDESDEDNDDGFDEEEED